MSAFAKLKDRAAQMEKLSSKVEQEKNGSSDPRYWKLSVDKANTGSAVIRFLPSSEGEEFPYVKIYSHQFEHPHRGSGQWFVENCPTTIEGECPICEANNDAWALGTDAGKDLARSRKRNMSYISNIYVVDDPAKPENNGKVFLFSYGARIFQKIEGSLKPEFADIKPMNPFDLWEGANFKLRARQLDGQRSYDMSVFEAPAPLASDEEMEAIWNTQHKLNPEVSADKFKDYTTLSSKWNKLQGGKAAPAARQEPSTDSFQRRSEAPKPPAAPAPQPSREENPDDPSVGAEPPTPAPRAPSPPPAAQPSTGGASNLADKYRAMLGKK